MLFTLVQTQLNWLDNSGNTAWYEVSMLGAMYMDSVQQQQTTVMSLPILHPLTPIGLV